MLLTNKNQIRMQTFIKINFGGVMKMRKKIENTSPCTIGLKCSSLILAAIIEFHILKCTDNPSYDKEMITKLPHNFYVHNVVTSSSNQD